MPGHLDSLVSGHTLPSAGRHLTIRKATAGHNIRSTERWLSLRQGGAPVDLHRSPSSATAPTPTCCARRHRCPSSATAIPNLASYLGNGHRVQIVVTVDLPLRPIAAGCPPGGVVLDPFSGAATAGLAALRLGRRYVGIDVAARFHDEAITRLTPCLPAEEGGMGG
jgi:site-specific DNA-methyltransferase (cytosine-N4-specific)